MKAVLLSLLMVASLYGSDDKPVKSLPALPASPASPASPAALTAIVAGPTGPIKAIAGRQSVITLTLIDPSIKPKSIVWIKHNADDDIFPDSTGMLSVYTPVGDAGLRTVTAVASSDKGDLSVVTMTVEATGSVKPVVEDKLTKAIREQYARSTDANKAAVKDELAKLYRNADVATESTALTRRKQVLMAMADTAKKNPKIAEFMLPFRNAIADYLDERIGTDDDDLTKAGREKLLTEFRALSEILSKLQ